MRATRRARDDESTDRLTPVGPDPWPVTRHVHPEWIMPPATGRQTEMSYPGQAVDQRVSAVLFEVIRTMPAEGLTLREIVERLGERGQLMLCMILTIPFLLPASIPGSSIPFGVLIALIAVGLVTHRAAMAAQSPDEPAPGQRACGPDVGEGCVAVCTAGEADSSAAVATDAWANSRALQWDPPRAHGPLDDGPAIPALIEHTACRVQLSAWPRD
jgi:Exopolysaccharide synthesis, ExoD